MEIEDSKLYREVVNNANYGIKHTHRIYWNKYILLQSEPNAIVYKWGETLDIPVGAWVESMDGTCLQLIKFRKYTNYKKYIFNFFYFCNSVVTAYYKKDGSIKVANFYGNYMAVGNHTMRQKRKTLTHSFEFQKIRFATLLVSGLDPYKAYRIAYGDRKVRAQNVLKRIITELLMDSVVKTEINNQLMPFIEKMKGKFSEEKLVNELELLIDCSRKGTEAHRENLRFIMELTGYITTADKKNKRLPDSSTPYEEVPPPGIV